MANTITLSEFCTAVDKSECILIAAKSGVNLIIPKADAKQWARSSLQMGESGDRFWRPYVILNDETMMTVGVAGCDLGALEVVP